MPHPSEVDIEELAEEGDESAHSRLINHAELERGADYGDREQFESRRRLGLRTPASFSVFVTSYGKRVRARAAEISTTGVLVDFRHSELCDFDGLVTLELVVPALPRPIRCAARLARHVGRLEAFEFMIIGRDDRLSLAEYIDRVAQHAQN